MSTEGTFTSVCVSVCACVRTCEKVRAYVRVVLVNRLFSKSTLILRHVYNVWSCQQYIDTFVK